MLLGEVTQVPPDRHQTLSIIQQVAKMAGPDYSGIGNNFPRRKPYQRDFYMFDTVRLNVIVKIIKTVVKNTDMIGQVNPRNGKWSGI